MVGNGPPPPLDLDEEPSIGEAIISGCAVTGGLAIAAFAIGVYVLGSVLGYW